MNFLKIENNPQEIPIAAFFNKQLKFANISETVKIIKNSAFAFNQLTLVKIPSSVESIESFAFSNNPQLSEIQCLAPKTIFKETGVFTNTASPLTIHVRAGEETWEAGEGQSFQGNENVKVLKDL